MFTYIGRALPQLILVLFCVHKPYVQEGFGKAFRQGLPPDLLGMEDEQWKQARRIITPSFSSRKLKMVYIIKYFTFICML